MGGGGYHVFITSRCTDVPCQHRRRHQMPASLTSILQLAVSYIRDTGLTCTRLSAGGQRDLSISWHSGESQSFQPASPLTSAWLQMIVRKFHQIASIMRSRRTSLIKRIERRKTDDGGGMDTAWSDGRIAEEGEYTVLGYNSQCVIRPPPAAPVVLIVVVVACSPI